MKTLTIFSAIGLCFIGALLVMLQNAWAVRHKAKKYDQNKSSIDLESINYQDDQSSTPIIAEIKNDETAINVLCTIKTLQDDYQENSEILGQPIRIPESEISKYSGVGLGITQLWIGKLTKTKFLKESFGDVYGVEQPGIEFLHKIGRLK